MISSIQRGAITLNAANYALTGTSGLGLAPIRESSFNLAGQHFGRFVSAFYGVRRFALDGMIIGDSIADYIARRTAFHRAFDASQGEQPVTFTLIDGRVLSLNAVVVSSDLAMKYPSAGEFHVELEAAFPFFVAATLANLILTLPTGGGGTVPPPTMPMGLSMGFGGGGSATNNGTAPAYPIIRIDGPASNPAIRNILTGQELRLTASLAVSEYLLLDVRERTVIDQGGTNRYSTKNGDWWTLQPGVNPLAFRADSSDPATQATITYGDTYLAI